jgi:hypothetical protein
MNEGISKRYNDDADDGHDRELISAVKHRIGIGSHPNEVKRPLRRAFRGKLFQDRSHGG